MTTVQTNKCIVSLATKNSRYVDGLARLSNSLRDNADGIDFLGFIHEKSVDAPLHTEMPYGFKVHAIQEAIDRGYTQVLWLDCSVYAVAPVQPIFDIIEQTGFWFEGAGCWLKDWCNDETLDFYELTREENIPMVQSGFMGFNAANNLSNLLFTSLKLAYNQGLFKGEWSNHRHDQSCMSIIANNYGIAFSHQPEYVQYAGVYDKVLNEKIILKCQGL